MTQEEKQLLFIDLCARLPYGIKFPYHIDEDSNHRECDCVATMDTISEDTVEFIYDEKGIIKDWSCGIREVKPYLRSMSSMTEEEKDNLQLLHNIISDENYGDGYSPSAWNAITEWEDYCNARHLDYRGLIKKDLALEAPEGIYKTE